VPRISNGIYGGSEVWFCAVVSLITAFNMRLLYLYREKTSVGSLINEAMMY